ncbi:MAG TPA: LysM domain-containing protein [Xanthomonadaceae bacterium]|nr:LysM domain-containing protein [Xanthomonadaceae bacterium]
MLKNLLTVCVAAMFTVAGYAAAVELRQGHPDVYVVVKGDTLWDIAGRFLKRPWLWPEIWQANPHIENPHLIYPGDVLSLAYLGDGSARVTTTQRIRREPLPVPAVPLSAVEAFLRDLRIIDRAQLERLPYVISLEEDRLRGVSGHLAYVRGMPEARPGEVYTILRPIQQYSRSQRNAGNFIPRSSGLDFRGNVDHRDWSAHWFDVMHARDDQPEFLGVELMAITDATVTRGEGHGIEVTTLLLADQGKEVRAGDVIAATHAHPYDLSFFPHPPAAVGEYGEYRVLAVSQALRFGGPMQVVAITGGTREGIDPGTTFSVWREGRNVADDVAHANKLKADNDRVRVPDEFAGHVMVFRSFDRISYGLVMEAIKPVGVGYHLKHPDATR